MRQNKILMQKIILKSVTTREWILFSAMVILMVIILVFIFRKVDVPGSSPIEDALRVQLDSVKKVQQQDEVLYKQRDDRRHQELDSLHQENDDLQKQINNAHESHDKIIIRYRNASAAELEKFFSDRYEK
jgi:uncharacterized protein YlxW (UPF0749 family)